MKGNMLNINGRLLSLERPRVMGILNLTPDSFYAQSRKQTEVEIVAQTERMLQEGADLIDVGACSTRPGAADLSAAEEMERLRQGLRLIRKAAPEAALSVDTYRADVARMCVEEFGVAVVNDISGGVDAQMFATVADLGVPYVLSHLRGGIEAMHRPYHYDDLLLEVTTYFAEKVAELRAMGVKDIILDPGFGFSKSVEQNYELLAQLEDLQVFELPLLVGVSRKSMIYKLLDLKPEEALNGTTVLHTWALTHGADLLRVHDVKEAVEAVRLCEQISKYQQ